MALLFSDGFDQYDYANLNKKWTQVTLPNGGDVDAAYGRLTTKGLRILRHSEGLTKTLGTSATTLVVGSAFNVYPNWSYGAGIWKFGADGTDQLYCSMPNDLSVLTWYRASGNVLLQTINLTIYPYLWYYLEAKITFNNTSGRIITRLNNVEIGDTGAGGIDTCSTSNEYANSFILGGNSGSFYAGTRYFDDVYVCDTTGSYCNDFLGDVWIQTVFPTGAGTTTEWSPSAGNNWDCVEETPPSTTDYVETSVLNEIDTYATGNVTSTLGTVNAVVINMYAAKTTAGARGISGAIDSGGTADTGTEATLSTDYANYQSISYEDPDTAAQWDLAGVNAAEFGVKLTT